MEGSKGAVNQATASSRFDPAADKVNINTSSKAGDKTPDSAAETAKRILGNAPETAADAAKDALRGSMSMSVIDLDEVKSSAQQYDRQAKNAVGNAVNDVTPGGSDSLGAARAVGSQVMVCTWHTTAAAPRFLHGRCAAVATIPSFTRVFRKHLLQSCINA